MTSCSQSMPCPLAVTNRNWSPERKLHLPLWYFLLSDYLFSAANITPNLDLTYHRWLSAIIEDLNPHKEGDIHFLHWAIAVNNCPVNISSSCSQHSRSLRRLGNVKLHQTTCHPLGNSKTNNKIAKKRLLNSKKIRNIYEICIVKRLLARLQQYGKVSHQLV